MAMITLPPWARTAFSMMLVIIGFTGQNVFIVKWLEKKHDSDPDSVTGYGVILMCGLSFFIIFGVAMIVHAWRTKDWGAFAVSDDKVERSLLVWPWRKDGGFQLSHAQILTAVGVLNSFNGFLIVFASPPQRTPPLIQAIFQNAGVLFSVPFSKLALGDRKRYCGVEPLLAGGVIASSVVLSLTPTILAIVRGTDSSGFDGASSVGWALVYLSGLAPGAAYNVFQQLYLLRVGLLEEDATEAETTRGILRALFWSNIAQPLAMIAFSWLDLVPWFGNSSSGQELWANTAYSLACSSMGPSLAQVVADNVPLSPSAELCGELTPLYAWAFIGSYAIAYVGGAMLNKESSVLQQLCLVIVTITTAVVWLTPANPNQGSATPLWSVLPSLALSLAGGYLWKRWESKTPAPEQFEVATPVLGPSGVPISARQAANLRAAAQRGPRRLTFEGDDAESAGAGEGMDSGEDGLGDGLDELRLEAAAINAPLLSGVQRSLARGDALHTPPRSPHLGAGRPGTGAVGRR